MWTPSSPPTRRRCRARPAPRYGRSSTVTLGLPNTSSFPLGSCQTPASSCFPSVSVPSTPSPRLRPRFPRRRPALTRRLFSGWRKTSAPSNKDTAVAISFFGVGSISLVPPVLVQLEQRAARGQGTAPFSDMTIRGQFDRFLSERLLESLSSLAESLPDRHNPAMLLLGCARSMSAR